MTTVPPSCIQLSDCVSMVPARCPSVSWILPTGTRWMLIPTLNMLRSPLCSVHFPVCVSRTLSIFLVQHKLNIKLMLVCSSDVETEIV